MPGQRTGRGKCLKGRTEKTEKKRERRERDRESVVCDVEEENESGGVSSKAAMIDDSVRALLA